MDVIPPYDMLALLLSAICHDLDHCGVSNSKLAEVQDPLAVRYKVSPLESNSVTLTFEVLQLEGCDVLSSLPAEAQTHIKNLLSDLIMATDITNTETVAFVQEEWKKNTENAAFDWGSDAARTALLRMCLLCADIGIVSEYFDIFIHWVRALFAEINVMLNGKLDLTNFYEGQLKFLGGYATKIFHSTCDARLLKGFEAFNERFNSNVVNMRAKNHLGAGIPRQGKRENIRQYVVGWVKEHSLEWSFEERDEAISNYKGALQRTLPHS